MFTCPSHFDGASQSLKKLFPSSSAFPAPPGKMSLKAAGSMEIHQPKGITNPPRLGI